MRVAVISDSHGELVALRCVLQDLDQQSVDHVVFAGDMAQGGPFPTETVDLLRSRGWPAVRGNSDDFLIRVANDDLDDEWPQSLIDRGRESVRMLGAQRLEYLANLPLQVRVGELLVVHATPWDNEEVVLADAPEEKAREMITKSIANPHQKHCQTWERQVRLVKTRVQRLPPALGISVGLSARCFCLERLRITWTGMSLGF